MAQMIHEPHSAPLRSAGPRPPRSSGSPEGAQACSLRPWPESPVPPCRKLRRCGGGFADCPIASEPSELPTPTRSEPPAEAEATCRHPFGILGTPASDPLIGQLQRHPDRCPGLARAGPKWKALWETRVRGCYSEVLTLKKTAKLSEANFCLVA